MAGPRWDVWMRRCAAITLPLCAGILLWPSTASRAQLPAVGGPDPLAGPETAATTTSPQEQVVEVRVEGNRVVPAQKIMAEVRTHAGRPFDEHLVQEDVRRLNATRKFLNVKTLYQQVPGGRVVIFQVFERPMAEEVRYAGNNSIKDKKLKELTGLDKGSPLDPYKIDEGRRKIEDYYREHGYNNIRVTVDEGTGPNDHRIVYLVNEGESAKIWKVNFIGNTIATGARLETQIQSKPGILWLFGGYVDPKKILEDEDRLKAYYRSLGFFSAEISRELAYNDGENWLTLTFVIKEGPRYTVRNVSFIGNTKFSNEQIAQGLKLKGNQYFDQLAMNKDLTTLKDLYGGQGYVLADVQANPRFSEDQPGTLDVVYDIKEGERWRVGRINVHITGDVPHTKEATVINRISLRPGDIVDTRQLRDSTRRLQFSQLFLVDKQSGQIPKIVFTPPDKDKDKDKDEDTVASKPKGSYRGQSPDAAEKLPPGVYRIEDGGIAQNGDRLIDVIYEVDDRATDSTGRTR